MDSFYKDMNGQDSFQNRSRSNSRLRSSTSELRGLNIINSSDPSRPLPQSFLSHRPSFELQDEHRRPSPSSTLILAPAVQQTTAFPIPSQQDNFDWTFNQTKESQSSVRVNPAELIREGTTDRAPLFHPTSTPANMSTVGIQQYDSRLDAGIQNLRQSYTWPNFDMNINQQYFQVPSPDLNASLTQFDEPKLIPMYARSISSSPPRGNLTPEQRELKRQRDFARRDSKSRIRRDRSISNPYVVSQHGSPNLVSGIIPEYTNSLSPSPLISQASPAMSSASFLTPFPAHIGIDNGQADLYAPVYTMGPNDFPTPAYNIPYSDPIPILPTQTFFPRPHSLPTSSDHQIYQPQLSPHHQHHISTTAKLESGDHIRLLPGRPKPQCWEHGCNGRQFSTFSNLLRHQREKSGVASKSSCPHCGAEFTRTTARNGHMAHEKCKQQRRNS